MNNNHYYKSNYLEELWFLGAARGEGANGGVRFIWENLFRKHNGVTENEIEAVLREVPKIFLKNWNPEGSGEVSEIQQQTIKRISSGSILPLNFLTVSEILAKAREYEKSSKVLEV